MKEIKRLTLDAPKDSFARTQRGLLRSVELSEAQFRAIERAQADHVVWDGEAVLIAQELGTQVDLHYAFPDRDAFVRLFPAMLDRITTVTGPAEGALGFRIRLRDAPSRPYVEPILLAHDFTPARDWWRMTLDGVPETRTSNAIVTGFSLREARGEDAEAIVAIDEAAFSTPWRTPQRAGKWVRDIEATAAGRQLVELRVLEELEAKQVVGYVRLREDFTGAGYISDVAVDDAYRRRGLGEAMMRWALAWFAEHGYGRAALTVNADNGGAIALYRKLGFVPAEAGADYRRPIDEEELRQARERRLGAHIKVRRRY